MDYIANKFKELGGIENQLNTSKSEIVAFLNDQNIILDNEFIDLLNLYIGQYFNKDIKVSNLDSVPIAYSGKIGIGSFLKLEEIKDSLEFLPNDVFPFLEGAPEDFFLIGYGTKNKGKIYYWHHESLEGKELYIVFENFKEFINSLIMDELNSDDDDDDLISYRLDF